jgi:hypothetical protein
MVLVGVLPGTLDEYCQSLNIMPIMRLEAVIYVILGRSEWRGRLVIIFPSGRMPGLQRDDIGRWLRWPGRSWWLRRLGWFRLRRSPLGLLIQNS